MLCVGLLGVVCCIGWNSFRPQIALAVLPGQVTVVVGTGAAGSNLDENNPELTQLNCPVGVAVALDGSVLIADLGLYGTAGLILSDLPKMSKSKISETSSIIWTRSFQRRGRQRKSERSCKLRAVG